MVNERRLMAVSKCANVCGPCTQSGVFDPGCWPMRSCSGLSSLQLRPFFSPTPLTFPRASSMIPTTTASSWPSRALTSRSSRHCLCSPRVPLGWSNGRLPLNQTVLYYPFHSSLPRHARPRFPNHPPLHLVAVSYPLRPAREGESDFLSRAEVSKRTPQGADDDSAGTDSLVHGNWDSARSA